MRIKLWFLVIAALLVASEGAFAKRTASGRRLPYDHWLTCWGGSDSDFRRDPPFHKDSPEQEVASYVPKFSGRYTFEVKDTWEETVTRSGTDCLKCGESCSGSGNNRSCSCNYCSWQETETYYRPWSTQTVNWSVEWLQDQSYREKRKQWFAAGKKEMSRKKEDLPKLFEFDPERPLEYFLFPGEVETVNVSNGGLMSFLTSARLITPNVSIGNPRHEYEVQLNSSRGSSFECNDYDFSVHAKVRTGKRKITDSPNSIQFRPGWIVAAQNHDGSVKDEPGEFQLTDISAMRYEGQNVISNYKDTRVQISLNHVDRFWYFLDVKVGQWFEIPDTRSIIQWNDENPKDKTPAAAVYNVKSSDLRKTYYFGKEFRLKPDEAYEVCTVMHRRNNIYYDTETWYGRDIWSDQNCAVFHYRPKDGSDLRSGGRKFRDGLSRFVGFGLF